MRAWRVTDIVALVLGVAGVVLAVVDADGWNALRAGNG